MLKVKIFWHDTVEMPSTEGRAPIPDKVDVAVIGGGYTGLSAACTLAKSGARVAVLEAETIGWGASSRNGGMTLTGLKVSIPTVFKRYGRDLARRLFQCSLESVDAVERIVKEERIDCGFARHGHLLAANKTRHYDGFQREIDFMSKEFDHNLKLVPPDDLQDEIGSTAYHGGIVDELSGGLNPAQYVTGLARAAQKAGASLHARARVQRLERGPNGFTLETERGKLVAKNVLVGTSGYTGKITKKLQRKIVPIGSFIIATEKLPAELAHELSPKNRMVFDSMHYLNYFRLWDDRLIFGGRAAFFPETPDTIRRSAEILRREMLDVFPQLNDTKVDYAWGGTLDFAFDMMPHVGEADGVYYSLGYAGHGVAMATYLGQTVAQAMLHGNIKDHPFAAVPFPGAPLGLYGGFPWFLPLAGVWQKLLDWLE
jgi:glycine/D-amino acid oxidase-like deaminating enzyme